jgi:hypothetical protein
MPDPANEPLALEATALRYAARSLTPGEAAAFESRLADDQRARDALSEAVRLSAAALQQDSPSPDRGFRRLVRNRLVSRLSPAAWVGLGAGAVAAAALFAVHVADRSEAPKPAVEPVASAPVVAPAPHVPATSVARAEEPEPASAADPDDMRKAAEIWAELSTPEHVEKAHDDEAKLHQRFKHLRPATGFDSREP